MGLLYREYMNMNEFISVRKLPWGTVNEKNVSLYELSRPGGISVKVSDYGGILQSFLLPGERERDIVLGYDTAEEYRRSQTFFGASVGPLADRVGGASLCLGGRKISLEQNAGEDCMHSGSAGFHAQFWNSEPLPDGVRFFASFTDAPLPGALDVSIAYTLPTADTLRISYDAVCTEETALSFTNHSYFSLEAPGEGRSCLGERLTLFASRYAETDCSSQPLVTGKALSVEGTPFDFRAGAVLEGRISAKDFPEIAAAGGVDNFFLTDGEGFRRQARLLSADGKTELICRSDAPGILVYTGNGLINEKGKNGERYGKHGGVALETENFPNAVNLPERRESVLMKPGEHFHTVTEFTVRVTENGKLPRAF